MAHENIQLQQSNFCLGPQAGTICTIDTTNAQTILRVKTTAGSTIIDLSLSSNILTSNIRLEYVGPHNLTGMVDGLTFFTFEKVSSTTCLIKRWQTRMAYTELLLKEQITKSNTGNEYYNAIDFAVEYYHRHFTQPNEYYNYIDMDSTTNMKSGTRLFIGPSTDADNIGATETAVVSHIIDYVGGRRVFLTAPLTYQHTTGDLITFYSHVYIYSSDGFAGDPNKGTLFKIDAYSWSTQEIDTKAIYKRVTASRWCTDVGGIASVIGPNMLFVRPYDSYLNWRSMFMNNVFADNNTIFDVKDIIFDGYSIYKLQKYITLRDDDGEKQTWSWSEYNYQEDTLLPYTNSIVTYIGQSILTGHNKNVDIETQVRDQYNVGLRDLTVNFYKSGDSGALFDPLNGLVTTDINGKATIDYRSGTTYQGHTEITTKVAGSSSSTGSQYVWTSNNIISLPVADPIDIMLIQLLNVVGTTSTRLINTSFEVYDEEEEEWVPPWIMLKAISYFTSPGGNWGSNYGGSPGEWVPVSEVVKYLPMLYRGPSHTDSPWGGSGFGFDNWPYAVGGPDEIFFIGNQIKLVNDFNSVGTIRSMTDFLLYTNGVHVPYTVILQPSETGHGQISQLKLSLHTHWVDGVAYDELWTYANIDQFVFVEDAIPKFWSEKNPIATDIWIRLRPFAFSLDTEALRMWVRVDSYLGDTRYYEVTDSITITPFDSGGGTLGVEVLYDSPTDFPHGSTVYVRIEVYDTAYDPNFIYVEYWFEVTPDYKAPYLCNLSPSRGDINLPVDSSIYLEIKDDGTGIDIDSIECLLNSRRFDSDNVSMEIVSRYHVKITYTPPEDLYFDKRYKVTVKVNDTAPAVNRMNDAYTFYTTSSTGVNITDPTPGICKRGMNRFQDVSVKVLADGNGVDEGTIRMQVFNADVNPKIVPVIYRVS